MHKRRHHYHHLMQELGIDYASTGLTVLLCYFCFWASWSFFLLIVYCHAFQAILSSSCLFKQSFHMTQYSIIFSFIKNILSSFLISSFLLQSLNVDPSTERKNVISATSIRLQLFLLMSRPHYHKLSLPLYFECS